MNYKIGTSADPKLHLPSWAMPVSATSLLVAILPTSRVVDAASGVICGTDSTSYHINDACSEAVLRDSSLRSE